MSIVTKANFLCFTPSDAGPACTPAESLLILAGDTGEDAAMSLSHELSCGPFW